MNIFYHKKVGINMIKFWINIFKMFIPMIICIIFAIIIKYFIPINTVLVLLAQIFVYTVLYCALVWKFSMNNYERDLILKPMNKLKRI